MPKPACLKCQRFYRPKRNCVRVIEGMPASNFRPASGTSDAEHWKPYKLWMADLWHCEGCGHELITGWGHQPRSAHYMPEFKEECEGAITQINDC